MQGLIPRLKAAADPGDPFAQDARNFQHHVWTSVLRLPEPAMLQYDIADWMQNPPVMPDGISRSQTQALRGAGKTYTVAMLICWLLYLNPDLKILTISSTGGKAAELCGLARQIIAGSPMLEALVPRRNRTGGQEAQIDNRTMFDVAALRQVSKDPSVQSYGVFGAWNGAHPDVIIVDDVEIPENSLTALNRERLYNKLMEMESLVNPGGAIYIQGTPQTEDSIYDKLATSYPKRRWPAEYPNPANEPACEAVSPAIMQKVINDPSLISRPTYPERFHEEALLEKKAIYGPQVYALQMLLDTSLADADRYTLKLRDLIVMDQDKEMAPTNVVWGTTQVIQHLDPPGLKGDRFHAPVYVEQTYAPYTTSVMFIDPTGGGSDSVGWAIARCLNGMVFVPDAGGLAEGKGQIGHSDVVMAKLSKIAAQYGIKRVVVETNMGDGMFERLLAPHMAKHNGPTQIDSRRSTGQKEKRILSVLEPLVGNHRLIVSEKVAKNQELMHQFTRLTRSRGSLQHDDQIDALAGACGEFVELAAQDPLVKERQRKDGELKEEVKQFVKKYQHQGLSFDSGRAPTPAESQHLRTLAASRSRRQGGRRWQNV